MDKQLVTFRTQHHLQISDKLYASINKSRVHFCMFAITAENQYWSKNNMKKIAQNISVWELQQLHLPYCDNMILRHIQECRFPSIKTIDLYGNKIESIEGLSRCLMTQLKNLWLGDNKLTNLRQFKKLHLKELALISLSHNKINEGTDLTGLPSVKLRQLRIQYSSVSQINDIRWIIKIQSHQLQDFLIDHPQRIHPIGLADKLQGKCKDLKIKGKTDDSDSQDDLF